MGSAGDEVGGAVARLEGGAMGHHRGRRLAACTRGNGEVSAELWIFGRHGVGHRVPIDPARDLGRVEREPGSTLG